MSLPTDKEIRADNTWLRIIVAMLVLVAIAFIAVFVRFTPSHSAPAIVPSVSVSPGVGTGQPVIPGVSASP